ncbi:MAG TPA: outer membrane protein transport protein, partial [Bacteroidales bacterium]|nr:outer membrane protein transport protein [Bacteroidales bacterium]
MIRRTLNLLTLTSLLFISGSTYAQMDNLANLSAKWIRSNIINAALDGGGDMVNFNPAGLALLNDGTYISLSNQTLFRKPKHTFNLGAGEQSYEQGSVDPILPMFYAAYKKNKWALSSGVYISGGGASADYPKGSFNTNLLGMSVLFLTNSENGTDYSALKDQSLDASSYYITVPLAFSYALNEKVALSAGARYIRGINKTKAGLSLTGSASLPDAPLDVDYKSNANGIGGVFGLDYAASEKLNIALHYETRVKLEFEADENKGSFVIEPDGSMSRRDLPAVINTGITYKFNDKLVAGIDYNYYFQKNAEWGTITDPATKQEKDAAKVAGDCYTANAGVYYQLTDKLQLSGGFSYTAFMF